MKYPTKRNIFLLFFLIFTLYSLSLKLTTINVSFSSRVVVNDEIAVSENFSPEESSEVAAMVDCSKQSKFEIPKGIEFPERQSNVSITFFKAISGSSSLRIPFEIKSAFPSPLLHSRVTYLSIKNEKVYRKMFLSDGVSSFFDPKHNSELWLQKEENSIFSLNSRLPLLFKIVSSDEVADIVVNVDIRLDLRSFNSSLSDDPMERLHSFIGSSEYSTRVYLKFEDESNFDILDSYLSTWFISTSGKIDLPTRDFEFNFLHDSLLKPSCKGIVEKGKRHQKYLRKRNNDVVDIVFFVDSQPKAECNTLRKTFGITRKVHQYFKLLPEVYINVKCDEFRYPTDNSPDEYLSVYRKWLERELLLPSDMKKEKKLFINFSGIHDNFCANLNALGDPYKYTRVIRRLLEASKELAGKSLYPVDFYFMSSTLTQNIVWEENWFMNQGRTEYINRVLESEVTKFPDFNFIDIGSYSKIGEFDTRSKHDIRHLSKHTNLKLLDLLLCRAFFEKL